MSNGFFGNSQVDRRNVQISTYGGPSRGNVLTPQAARFAASTSRAGHASRDPLTDRALDALNEQYLRRRLRSLGVDGPISLWSLPDYPPDVKPPIEHSVLVMVALYAAPTKKLCLQEILDAIMERYPYFRSAKSSWQHSIRHSLSLKIQFCRIDRPASDPGRGGYWYLDLTHGEGDCRERKRKPAKTSSFDSVCDDACSEHAWV
ncbi:winged helix DNA-binding domain-containing protein [Schizophyllum commune Loenen D]|nr:winged helix DNA-binding domain-containing protein [Schizophyllum commune Loenen D]